MKLQKHQLHAPKKKVHYSNEKAPNFAKQESSQNNGEVISIFKALERCSLKLAL